MRKGALLLEVLVSIVMLGMVAGVFFPATVNLVKKSYQLKHAVAAAAILQEGMEVAYNVFLTQWSDWDEGVYHPAVIVGAGGRHWTLVSGEETALETRFTRRLEISEICRNPQTGEIKVNCGGGDMADEFSRMVKVTVSWDENEQTRRLTTAWVVAKL